jgi:hypothetical protein
MTLVLGVSATPGQEKKKPPPTLEEDWKTLCRFQWVNSDPKEAWALLPKDWKEFLFKTKKCKEWTSIELSFKDGRPDKKEYRQTAVWYFLDGKGKKETESALYGTFFDGLREEKGDRFLLLGKAKIKYELKEGVLILNGIDDSSKGAMPGVYTGKYKGVERKDKK